MPESKSTHSNAERLRAAGLLHDERGWVERWTDEDGAVREMVRSEDEALIWLDFWREKASQ